MNKKDISEAIEKYFPFHTDIYCRHRLQNGRGGLCSKCQLKQHLGILEKEGGR